MFLFSVVCGGEAVRAAGLRVVRDDGPWNCSLGLRPQRLSCTAALHCHHNNRLVFWEQRNEEQDGNFLFWPQPARQEPFFPLFSLESVFLVFFKSMVLLQVPSDWESEPGTSSQSRKWTWKRPCRALHNQYVKAGSFARGGGVVSAPWFCWHVVCLQWREAVRVARSQASMTIVASPSSSVDKKKKIKLSVKNVADFDDLTIKHQWKCSKSFPSFWEIERASGVVGEREREFRMKFFSFFFSFFLFFFFL